MSWNAFLPNPIDGNLVLKGLLNGWQLSGISTFASGVPFRLRFTATSCRAGSRSQSSGLRRSWVARVRTVRSVYTCDPRTSGGANVGEKLSTSLPPHPEPAAGEIGDLIAPYDLRTPSRMNHDVTLFKNFQIRGDQKLQFRVGMFNIFNMAYASPAVVNDIDFNLETRCLRRGTGNNGVGGTGEVCDPFGGFELTPNAINNFGKVNLKRATE